MKPLIQSAQADQDLEEALEWYWKQGGPDLTERFIEAFEAARDHIARHPGTGSPRYARGKARTPKPAHAGLRFWLLTHFPFAIFYIERDTHIDIVRVLHQSSNLQHHLNNPESP